MKGLHKITWILLIIGGLNWGLKVFGWDIEVWGLPSSLISLIYLLVGISALVELFTHKNTCKECMVKSTSPTSM